MHVVLLIEPALVLFPPLNCTCVLEHSDINSTHKKKYGISLLANHSLYL